MWVLIWTVWLSNSDAITTWEGKSPQLTHSNCIQIGQIRRKQFTPKKVSFHCKYYTKSELLRIYEEEKSKKAKSKEPLI